MNVNQIGGSRNSLSPKMRWNILLQIEGSRWRT
jgi:hypothetical protein